ncbi:MAG: hypothetical protein ABSD38_27250 [Syntrophorhabdales bacterium]
MDVEIGFLFKIFRKNYLRTKKVAATLCALMGMAVRYRWQEFTPVQQTQIQMVFMEERMDEA